MKKGKRTVMLISTAELRNNFSESTRMLYISKGLNKHGISTVLIGRSPEFGDRIEEENIVAIKPIFKIFKGFIGEILFRLHITVFACQILFSNRINKVILRGYDLIFLAIFLKITGKKIIYDFHGYFYKEQVYVRKIIRSKATKIFDSLMLMMADHIISVSEGFAKDIQEKYKQKTIVLSNGVDLDLFNDNMVRKLDHERYKLSINKKTIGFVGNWESWMNIRDILDVSKYLKNVQILIVGKGDMFEELCKATKNNPSIVWTGNVDHSECIKLINYIDICITPYSKDIFFANTPGTFASRKNKEYMAAGKPIIISNIIGREQFLDGENVLLYEPGNAKDLADKIQLLLEDKLLYRNLQENNKKLSKEFGWDKSLEKSGLLCILTESN